MVLYRMLLFLTGSGRTGFRLRGEIQSTCTAQSSRARRDNEWCFSEVGALRQVRFFPISCKESREDQLMGSREVSHGLCIACPENLHAGCYNYRRIGNHGSRLALYQRAAEKRPGSIRGWWRRMKRGFDVGDMQSTVQRDIGFSVVFPFLP